MIKNRTCSSDCRDDDASISCSLLKNWYDFSVDVAAVGVGFPFRCYDAEYLTIFFHRDKVIGGEVERPEGGRLLP